MNPRPPSSPRSCLGPSPPFFISGGRLCRSRVAAGYVVPALLRAGFASTVRLKTFRAFSGLYAPNRREDCVLFLRSYFRRTVLVRLPPGLRSRDHRGHVRPWCSVCAGHHGVGVQPSGHSWRDCFGPREAAARLLSLRKRYVITTDRVAGADVLTVEVDRVLILLCSYAHNGYRRIGKPGQGSSPRFVVKRPLDENYAGPRHPK